MSSDLIVDHIENRLFVVRDDLFPTLGGGNKGRKIRYIGKHLINQGYDAVVTTGGIQSNHCRATAIFAVQNNIPCTIVLHGEQKRFYQEGGNAKIVRDSGVEVVFSEAEDISTNMDSSMERYIQKGHNPYYLWGGGHSMEGGKAYMDAVLQLIALKKTQPDYIFLASGTGSTQAGIMTGLAQKQHHCKVIGISIARKKQRAEEVVSKFCSSLCKHYNVSENFVGKTLVLDDYLCGGYEQSNTEIDTISKTSISKYGFTLDTTYTAKAFYGMMDYINKNKIEGNIFFWHTGGILNYLK